MAGEEASRGQSHGRSRDGESEDADRKCDEETENPVSCSEYRLGVVKIG